LCKKATLHPWLALNAKEIITVLNRYSISFLSVLFLILVGSYATGDQPYVYCKGEGSYNEANPSELVDDSVIAIRVLKNASPDLIQQGKVDVTLCGIDDLPTLNDGNYLVLPQLEPGKISRVFTANGGQSLEVKRWLKKDTFEGAFQAPALLGDQQVNAVAKVTCKVSNRFPKDLCDPKVKF
jgi:hypothetical protein